MEYGAKELAYAKPIADALAADSAFRAWMLSKTAFADVANIAVSLHEEMSLKRSKNAKYWWRSHYTERCRCYGCRGRETDLLAIFEAAHLRFALHIEVKNPSDRFTKVDQAPAYPVRALCWTKAGKAPPAVPEHDRCATMLLFSERQRDSFAPHLQHFDTLLTFEQIAVVFPQLVPKPSVNLP